MYNYKATIVKVYDGDTVTAVVDLGFSIQFKMRLRLLGIDTPELRGIEREEGLKVRDLVRELILNKEVEIFTKKDKKGKYGRYLATIFINELNVNTWLLQNKYATEYLK